jgi:hypothetical protein
MFQMNLIKKLKTSFSIRLSNDNRFLCHNMGSKTIVYDVSSWEKIIELTKPNYPSILRFSKNNDYLMIKNTIGTICIYNTVDFKLVQTLQSNKSLTLIEGNVNFTQDNLILDVLQTNNGHQIALIDIFSKEYKILSEFGDSLPRTGFLTIIHYNQFIPTEEFHLLTLSYVDETDYRVNKIVKVKEPLSKESIQVISNSEICYWESMVYNPISQNYILVNDYEITIVNKDFKEVLNKKCILENDHDYPERAGYSERVGYFCHLHVSNDGQFIVVTYSDNIFILKSDDLTTILTENIEYACFAEFSNDNRYLLVGTWKNGYVLENILRN